MFDRFTLLVRRLLSSAERDRMEEKLEKINDKFDHFDDRLDALESSQAMQNEKLSSIREITLANNEALEQKLNRSTVTSQSVREIVDFRIEAFQESLRRLEVLISELLRRKGDSD